MLSELGVRYAADGGRPGVKEPKKTDFDALDVASMLPFLDYVARICKDDFKRTSLSIFYNINEDGLFRSQFCAPGAFGEQLNEHGWQYDPVTRRNYPKWGKGLS
jgi:hypothetical protein